MLKTALPDLINTCLQKGVPFASYRLPGDDPVTVIQGDGDVERLTDASALTARRGFMVAPFTEDPNCPHYLLRPDFIVQGTDVDGETLEKIAGLAQVSSNVLPCSDLCYEVAQDEYFSQVEAIVGAIEAGRIQKAVLSRIHCEAGDYRARVVDTYLTLCQKYPTAMAYLFCIGEHLWLGATPEILASMQNGEFCTLALAATKPYSDENRRLDRWGAKEVQEHQFVVDYISHVLQKSGLTSFSQSPRYVRQAGNLLHLCCDFTAAARDVRASFGDILQALHPTPAVCGMPKDEAQTFLLDLEGHDRQYYAGYLGPVNIVEDEIVLYVNLRCMRVCRDHARIIVGGGITYDSVAADEWEETVMKSRTTLSVFKA